MKRKKKKLKTRLFIYTRYKARKDPEQVRAWRLEFH